eukprot:gnl/Hemi2/22345_TR7440_c0_g1_i1.p2 gnl/Hemi2/22345_TR7440_c0_g1~~gnl/Hemi2/22345_TR7440_c0_g1_i1.p2  ORF type:complete len:192 (+),score=21.07 gnl/Hemi2/22345_TR7440_c0_g1_i1:1016-1591(+)
MNRVCSKLLDKQVEKRFALQLAAGKVDEGNAGGAWCDGQPDLVQPRHVAAFAAARAAEATAAAALVHNLHSLRRGLSSVVRTRHVLHFHCFLCCTIAPLLLGSLLCHLSASSSFLFLIAYPSSGKSRDLSLLACRKKLGEEGLSHARTDRPTERGKDSRENGREESWWCGEAGRSKAGQEGWVYSLREPAS